jgi:hypothetical protein
MQIPGSSGKLENLLINNRERHRSGMPVILKTFPENGLESVGRSGGLELRGAIGTALGSLAFRLEIDVDQIRRFHEISAPITGRVSPRLDRAGLPRIEKQVTQ